MCGAPLRSLLSPPTRCMSWRIADTLCRSTFVPHGCRPAPASSLPDLQRPFFDLCQREVFRCVVFVFCSTPVCRPQAARCMSLRDSFSRGVVEGHRVCKKINCQLERVGYRIDTLRFFED